MWVKLKKNMYNLQIDVIQPEKHTHNNNPNRTTNIMIQDNVRTQKNEKNEKYVSGYKINMPASS